MPEPSRRPLRERRELDAMVHRVLLVGGAAAALFLLSAVLAAMVERRPLARSGLSPAYAWRSLQALHPGGLASVGLIVLIFTPVIRVLGSVVVFVIERDFRHALIALLVLSLMVASFLLGHG